VFLQKYDDMEFSRIFEIILLRKILWNWFMGLYNESMASAHGSMTQQTDPSHWF
jgi:hypothetical protein